MDSTLVFLVAQVVNDNPEAMLRPVGGGPAMTPTGQSRPCSPPSRNSLALRERRGHQNLPLAT
jgi:hypothetical protein